MIFSLYDDRKKTMKTIKVSIVLIISLSIVWSKTLSKTEVEKYSYFKSVNNVNIEYTVRPTDSGIDTTTIYFDDFEGTTEWTGLDLTVPVAIWHVDDFNTPDGTGTSWWMGDPVIGGYYDHSYVTLDSPEILVPTGGHLTFDLNYNVEAPGGGEPKGYDGWDGCNVRISTNGGSTWTVISGTPVYSSSSLYSFGFEHGEGTRIPGYTGSSNGWVNADYDLSSYAGQNVMIRFAFASDPEYSTVDNSSMFGMIVDNISLGSFSNNGTDDGTMTAESQVPVAGDLWHVYEDQSAPSPTHAVGCFDENTGTYNPGMENYFVSPEIELPSGNSVTFFDFYYKSGLDEGTFPDADFLYVEVEFQGVWNSVSNPTGDPNGLNFVFTGSTDEWTAWSVAYGYNDITVLAGETVRFRVGLHSNDDTPSTIGFHIDNFHIFVLEESIPQIIGVYAEAGDGTVYVSWNDINVESSGDIIYDDGQFDPNESIIVTGGAGVAGTLFDMPFGVSSVTVNTVSVFGDENSSGASNIYGYAVEAGVPNETVLISSSITTIAGQWTEVRVDWTFSGDFIIGYEISENIACVIDSDVPGDQAHSWTNLGSWLDWTVTATNNGFADGEWGIRVNVNVDNDMIDASYNVYRNVEGSDFNPVSNGQDLSEAEYTDNLVQNDTEYCYKVTAQYGIKEGPLSNSSCAIPEANTVHEISYDDGGAETSTNVGPDNYMSVKMTLLKYPSEINRVKFFVPTTTTGSCEIRVWDDDGENGLPGTELTPPSGIIMQLAQGWNVKDISSAGLFIGSGDFYIGWEETSNTPPIGIDLSNPDFRSYINVDAAPPVGTNGEWTELYLEGDFMVRVDVDSGLLAIGNELNNVIPKTFTLKQNYPNPFNPATNIEFDLPEFARTHLAVFDVTGREIITIVNNENLNAGHYRYQLNASGLSSGIYFYRIIAVSESGNDFFDTKKLIMLK